MHAVRNAPVSRLPFLLLPVLAALALAGCAEQLDELLNPEESPTPTASPTATPTATPEPDPTPSSTTTDGDIVTFDWGSRPLPAGQSPTFTFDAPANVIGLDFIAHGAAADREKIFAFYSVIAPGNRTVINASSGGPVRQGYNDGVMSLGLPADDSSASAVAPGTWVFHIAAFDASGTSLVASTPQVLVKARTAPGGTVPDGVLDLNVIVVADPADPTWDASVLQGSSAWATTLSYVSGLYDTIGIQLGDVDYYDLADGSFSTVSTVDELKSLFETSGTIQDDRVNVFVVGDLAGELSNAAGVAGGVPIPMDLNGTVHSGVAITLQFGGGGGYDAVATSEVITHEIGHSLGLYHTTEFDASTDPIGDTVSCPDIATQEGSCPDRDNVMFPRLTGIFDHFTAGQGIVVRPTMHVRQPTTPAFTAQYPPAAKPIRTGGPRFSCEGGVLWRD